MFSIWLLILLQIGHGDIMHSPDLPALDKLYDYEHLGDLKELLRSLKSSTRPEHIQPLMNCLEKHVEKARNTRIGEDPERNLLYGTELYGDAGEMLHETLILYFRKFAEPASSIPLLYQLIQNFLVGEKAPFTYRGFAQDFERNDQTLYIILPQHEAHRWILNQFQSMLRFKIELVDTTRVQQLLEGRGIVPVLEIREPSRFGSYYLTHYSLQFKNASGVPSTANFVAYNFYREENSHFKLIN